MSQELISCCWWVAEAAGCSVGGCECSVNSFDCSVDSFDCSVDSFDCSVVVAI